MPSIFWTQKQDIGPSARTGHGMAYDAARQRVVVFGGDPGGPPLADTWLWNGSLWTQVADTGPAGRHGVAMADHPGPQRIVLFGGASGSSFFADTWTWDGVEWTQVADTGPLGRAGHAIAFDGTRQRIVLFGGEAGAPFGDTWEWAGSEWTQVQDVGPSARSGHAMAFDPGLGRVILFGGAGADGAGLGDTWAWDGSSWTQVADTGPEPRVGAALIGTGSVILFGGVNSLDLALPPADRRLYGDSWLWDGEGWTKVQDIGPAARWGHGMAFRIDAARTALFGGGSLVAPAEDAALGPGLRRDTWEVPDIGAQPGGGVPEPVNVDVESVSVTPDTVGAPGEALQVTVTMYGPPPAGTELQTAIFFEDAGGWTPVDPPGFTMPTVAFDGTATSVSFSIVRDATYLTPGQYAVGAGIPGGMMQGALITVM